MRRIAIFTATRAEYGLLRPVLFKLRESISCDIELIVSGTHLSDIHGYTLSEIENDGFTASATIPLDLSEDSPKHLSAALGIVCSGVGQALTSLTPDILVLLGDRYECLGAAAAATLANTPIAHIHGGDITEGAIDDCLRHAITKMSHLHFPSCEEYRQRIIQMGEQPNTVWNVGALGVENARKLALMDETHLRKSLKLQQNEPFFLCTFHPVTLESGNEKNQMAALFKALVRFESHRIIFTGANADPGGTSINSMLREFASHNEQMDLYPSLGVHLYLSAAKYASCVVGNSSSGIVEIPSLGTPVVNIGNRQKGRVASKAVINCAAHDDEIYKALLKAQSHEHRKIAVSADNPYEGVDTSKSISEIILTHTNHNMLNKKFFTVPSK